MKQNSSFRPSTYIQDPLLPCPARAHLQSSPPVFFAWFLWPKPNNPFFWPGPSPALEAVERRATTRPLAARLVGARWRWESRIARAIIRPSTASWLRPMAPPRPRRAVTPLLWPSASAGRSVSDARGASQEDTRASSPPQVVISLLLPCHAVVASPF